MKAEKKPTQCERIIAYMNQFGSITTLEAFMDLGCARLASRINDLKRKGYNITSEFESSPNRYGEKVSYKRYRFAESEGNVNG